MELDLGKLKITIGVDNQEAKQKLNETADSVSGVGSKIGSALGGIGKGIAVGAAAVAAGTAAIATKVWGMANDVASAASDINDASIRMGLGSEEYQKLGYAAQQSGVSMENLEAAAKKLQASGSELNLEQAIQQIASIEDADARAAAATELFGKSAYNLTPLLANGTAGIAALYSEAEQYGAVMSGDIVNAGDAFGDSLDKLGSTAEGVKNKFVGELLPSLTQTMDGLAGMLAGVEGADETFSEGLTNVATSAASTLPKFLEIGTTIITSLINGIVVALPTILPAVVNMLLAIVNCVINNLPMIITAGVQCVISLIQGLAKALPQLIPAIVNAVLTITQALIDNIPLLIEAAIQLFLGLIEGLIQAIPQIIAAIPTLITSLINAILGSIPQIIQAGITLLISLVQNLPVIIKAIIAAIPEIITGIVNALIENLPVIIEAGVQLFIALIENLPTIIIEIVKAIPQIIVSIVEALLSHFGDIASAGENLIKGIWDGIKNAASWVWEKVSGWCSDLVGKIKNFFGIHSPSTMFAGFGLNIVQGLANGITENTGLAVNAMEAMGTAVSKAFKPAISIPSLDTSPYSSSSSAVKNSKAANEQGKTGSSAFTQNNYFTAKETTPYEQQVMINRIGREMVAMGV